MAAILFMSSATSVVSHSLVRSEDQHQGEHLQRESSAFERRAHHAHNSGQLQIAHGLLNNAQAGQMLVLTTGNRVGQQRLNQLLKNLGHDFDNFNVTQLAGIDMRQFTNEDEEMSQNVIPMNREQRAQWLLTDMGFGPVHGKRTSKEYESNGALACSLGHWKMWQLASNATSGKWTVILEDDAQPAAGVTGRSLEELLATVPEGVDEVFLDDRHCQSFGGHVGVVSGSGLNHFAMGSTAYAVTAAGAKAMLAVPFRYPADHWLNVPVRTGAIKAYCPAALPAFVHEYSHRSVINSFLQGR